MKTNLKNIFTLSSASIAKLSQCCDEEISDSVNNVSFQLKFAIPNYQQKVSLYYADILSQCKSKMSDFYLMNTFVHFGLQVDFSEPVELNAYDDDFSITGNVKELIKQFGIVLFKNVYLSDSQRQEGHINRFPHLSFHRDRNETQPTPYSLFCRNPFDAIQKHPRLSSTLFSSNYVTFLQCFKEKGGFLGVDINQASHYDLFEQEDEDKLIKDAFNRVIYEHTWSAPEGVGELTIMDNRTLMHASYYRHIEKGYRIGVRYLK